MSRGLVVVVEAVVGDAARDMPCTAFFLFMKHQ